MWRPRIIFYGFMFESWSHSLSVSAVWYTYSFFWWVFYSTCIYFLKDFVHAMISSCLSLLIFVLFLPFFIIPIHFSLMSTFLYILPLLPQVRFWNLSFLTLGPKKYNAEFILLSPSVVARDKIVYNRPGLLPSNCFVPGSQMIGPGGGLERSGRRPEGALYSLIPTLWAVVNG